MEDLKIESGIPIPPKAGVPGSITQTMRRMNVGDSVVVSAKSVPVMRNAASKVLRIKISARRIDETTYRVWRTA